MAPSVTRLLPVWNEDAGLKVQFRQALWDSGGARARRLHGLLQCHEGLRVHLWSLNLADFFIVMITSKDTELLRNLGEDHCFPRGYPVIWQPGQRLHLCGFYPKFKNDAEYRSISTEGVSRLSLTIKWSGFLFALLAFSHENNYYWVVTSKNSANCVQSPLEDFTQLAADVIASELGDTLPFAIKLLADRKTYLCGECLSMSDQGHGYSYHKDAAMITCAGKYDNQYRAEQDDASLLLHLPLSEMRTLAQECGFRCVQQLEVPSSKVQRIVDELEAMRDFLTLKTTMRLLARYGLPVEQFREHADIIDSDTLEGLVMHYHYSGKPSLRVKWKLPRYTFVTTLLRPVRKNGISSSRLVDKSASMAKSWCRTQEGCDYFTCFGVLAGELVKDLPGGTLVAPWISAAEEVLALEHGELLRRGRQVIERTRDQVSAALTKSKHILHVQKHDSIGCALVTFTSSEAGVRPHIKTFSSLFRVYLLQFDVISSRRDEFGVGLEIWRSCADELCSFFEQWQELAPGLPATFAIGRAA